MKRYIDFLVLIPSYMSGNRNYKVFSDRNDLSITNFLGNSNWRKTWSVAQNTRTNFGDFITNEFCKKMENIEFLKIDNKDIITVKEHQKNLKLYHLALFSKNKLAHNFWSKAVEGTSNQICLDL
ncbi:hypothetical protein ACFLSX_03935 [Calditrichota bacterium]